MFNVAVISHLIPIVATWHLVYREISKYKPENVSKNITDMLHSTIFMLHYNNDHDLLYATQISIGFYVYDIIYMLKCDRRAAKYILYDMLAIYMLNMSTIVSKYVADSILYGHSILEMSNIGLYMNKHIAKEWSNKTSIGQLVEFMWYTYFRVVKLTPHMVKISADVAELGIEVWLMLAIIYGIGILWSYKMLMINVQNYMQLKKVASHAE